jgi:hypothetical protein
MIYDTKIKNFLMRLIALVNPSNHALMKILVLTFSLKFIMWKTHSPLKKSAFFAFKLENGSKLCWFKQYKDLLSNNHFRSVLIRILIINNIVYEKLSGRKVMRRKLISHLLCLHVRIWNKKHKINKLKSNKYIFYINT